MKTSLSNRTSAVLEKADREQLAEKLARKPYLTPSEACAYLDLSQATLYRLLRDGELPARRLGTGRGQWRIDRSALDASFAKPKALSPI